MKHVLLYTLNYCPFSKKALDFLKEKGIVFENVDVTYDEENMTEKIKKMFNLPEPVTFPQIVIGKENIGGYAQLMRLERQGKLDKLLQD